MRNLADLCEGREKLKNSFKTSRLTTGLRYSTLDRINLRKQQLLKETITQHRDVYTCTLTINHKLQAIMPSLLLYRGATSGVARTVRATSRWRYQHPGLSRENIILSMTTARKSGSFVRSNPESRQFIHGISTPIRAAVRHMGSSSSGVARPALKPMRSVLYTPGSSRHLYKIRDIACDVSLIDLEVGAFQVL